MGQGLGLLFVNAQLLCTQVINFAEVFLTVY
jgi:hypothetical protein